MGCKPAHTTGRRKIAGVIQAQRKQLFKAASVINLCAYASSEGFDLDQMEDALRAARDLIDGVAAALKDAAEQISAGGAQ